MKINFRRLMFGLPMGVLLAGGLYILVVSVLHLRAESQIRLPSKEDQRYAEQFQKRNWGLFSEERYQSVDKKAKLIGVIETRLPPTLRIESRLYLVNSGKTQQISNFSGWNRQSHRKSIDNLLSRGIELPLVLYDYDVTLEEGHSSKCISAVRAYGTRQNGGGGGWEYKPFKREMERTYLGKLDLDQEYLVYVRGDSEFRADREMTMTEFSKTNPGNYLVVTVKLVSR